LRFLLLATVASASILRNGEEDNSGHNPLDIHNNPDLAWMLNNESSRNGEQDNGGHNPLDIHNNPDLAWMMNNDNKETGRALNDCGCAEVKSAGRIVGGAEVTAHSLPYQVYVQAGGYMCGGTILNKRYVLTAMHCLFDQNGQKHATSTVSIIMGEHNICDGLNEGGQKIGVEKYVERSDYNTDTLKNDIALLRLKSDIKFSDKVKPACLPTSAKAYTNVMATVSGWGGTVQNNPGQQVQQKTACKLKATNIKILANSDDQCKQQTRGVSTTQVCAYGEKTDSCQGDSGGPLVVNDGGKYVVVGVVSYGQGCAYTTPGVYARVSSYMDWIKTNIADGACGGGSNPATTTKATTTKATTTKATTTKATTTKSTTEASTTEDYNYGNYNYYG